MKYEAFGINYTSRSANCDIGLEKKTSPYKNFTDIPVLLRSLGFQNYKYNFSS